MKALKRVLLIGALALVGGWVVAQIAGRNAPEGLGVINGGLADCPETPNCVCSDCEQAGKMAPLQFSGEASAAKAALKKALAAKGIPIVTEQENYIHAVATTPIMRFHDDLEFLLEPEEKRIQFRSASRLGKSDLGKNRARMEEILKMLERDGIRPAARRE